MNSNSNEKVPITVIQGTVVGQLFMAYYDLQEFDNSFTSMVISRKNLRELIEDFETFFNWVSKPNYFTDQNQPLFNTPIKPLLTDQND